MAAECGLAAAIASPLLECGKIVFGPIYRNTKSFFKLQSNLNSLEEARKDLKEMEDNVKQELEEAEKHGKLRTPQVKKWLGQVEKILGVADQMQPGRIADDRGLVSGCFLSCSVCRKVRKTLEEVERLTDSCPSESERVVSTKLPPPRVEYIPLSIEDQTTAAETLNRVMELLSGDEVRSVGIWGMGGVGKTTLVKNLNNKLERDPSSGHDFGIVILATVSKDFNLKRVQAQIAERLKMEAGLSDDEDRNAVKLHQRLMKETKFLLILDDLWETIDLDKLGIPMPQVHKGVKILLTSRIERVCQNMTDKQLQVHVLNLNEAWQLFVKKAGHVAELEGIEPIAWKVCKQCGGLPLAVSVMGAAMKGIHRIALWENALTQLESSVPSMETEEKVLKPLKWSYDQLQGNDVKSCFLYCCLYPEDFSIKVSELVKCWIGEGLIDEELNYEQSRNRGLALIQSLKEACLLEGSEDPFEESDTVKMHGVVRDVAIWISSNHLEDGGKFLVRAGMRLTNLSQVTFPNDAEKISFMNNQIDRLPWDDACLIKCSKASTLFLQGNDSLNEIPDEFFRQFQAMKVLNLSDTNISSLPPSIMQLTKLGTLLLQGCGELKELPTSGWEGLGRLQILDLAYTAIWELPSEMARLIRLRELNLYRTKSLKSIPAGVFSKSSSLEILDMEESSYIWGLKGAVEDGEAYLEQLERLDTLRELFIQVKPQSSLSWIIDPTWIERLRWFTICIGKMPGTYGLRRKGEMSMIVNGINPAEEERIEYLLSITKATSVCFYDCVSLDKLLVSMGVDTNVCFSAIKCLTIQCVTINLRDTLGGGCGAKHDLLPNLEELGLHKVSGMRSISELVGHLGLTLSKLQVLYVSGCNEMKYLWSVAGHPLILQSLTKIKIKKCSKLEVVFEYAPHQDNGSIRIVPNLKEVYLRQLQVFRTICDNNEAVPWSGLEIISVIGCDQVRKLPICTNNSLKKISGEESWWNNLELNDLDTKISLEYLWAKDHYVCNIM